MSSMRVKRAHNSSINASPFPDVEAVVAVAARKDGEVSAKEGDDSVDAPGHEQVFAAYVL
eukprot:758112-Hanusia_phi.AAC.2